VVSPRTLWNLCPLASLSAIRVLVADSNQMECQLLVSALGQRPEFDVICCAADLDAMLQTVATFPAQISHQCRSPQD